MQALQPSKIINNYKGLITNKYYIKNLTTFGLLFGSLITYLAGAPFVLIHQLHMKAEFFGFTQLIIFGAYILSSLIVSRIASKFERKLFIIIGNFIILISGILMIIFSLAFSHSIYSFFLPMVGFGVGFGFVSSNLTAEVMSRIETAGGSAAALLGFSMTLFGSIGSLAVSIFYNGTMISVSLVIFAMIVLATIMCFFVKKKKY